MNTITEDSQNDRSFASWEFPLSRRVIIQRLFVLVVVSAAFNAAWGYQWLGGSTAGWVLLLSGLVADMVIRSWLSFVLVPIALLLPVSIAILVVSPIRASSWPNPYWIGALIAMTVIFSLVTSIGIGCSILTRFLVHRTRSWVSAA